MRPQFNRVNHSPVLEASYGSMNGVPQLVKQANSEAEGVLTPDLLAYTTAHFFGSRIQQVLDPNEETYFRVFLQAALPRVVLADLIRRRNREKAILNYSFAHETVHAAVALLEPNGTGLPKYLFVRTNESVITPYFDEASLLEEVTAMPWSISDQEPGKEGKKRPLIETIFDRKLALPLEPMTTLQTVTNYPVIHELCDKQLQFAQRLIDKVKQLNLSDCPQVLAFYCDIFRNLLLSAFWVDLHGTLRHPNFTQEHAEDIAVVYGQADKFAHEFTEKLQAEAGQVPGIVKSYAAGVENPKIGFELFKELIGTPKFPCMKSILTPQKTT